MRSAHDAQTCATWEACAPRPESSWLTRQYTVGQADPAQPTDPSVPGGCVFTHAAVELDDKPGPVRDALAHWQREWKGMLARAASIAVDEKQFRKELDTQQFAFQMFGIVFAYYHAKRLLEEKDAESQARSAFEGLVRGASA